MTNGIVICLALALLVACTKQDESKESQLGYRLPEGETHLTVTFPAVRPSGSFQGRPAVTMRIPREYVRFRGVLRKNGQIYQVPLEIELPGPTPWQERPWLAGKKGTPEWDAFMKGWIGKFIVTVGSGSGLGGRSYFLNSINPKNSHRRTDMVADGEAYGLVRYSPKRCYTDENLKDPQIRAFLDAKPADDPTPEANCRLSRQSAEYFSPLNVTEANQVVVVHCSITACDVGLEVIEGIGASLHLRPNQIERWPDIISPARELLKNFIVWESHGSAPPPKTTSSR